MNPINFRSESYRENNPNCSKSLSGTPTPGSNVPPRLVTTTLHILRFRCHNLIYHCTYISVVPPTVLFGHLLPSLRSRCQESFTSPFLLNLGVIPCRNSYLRRVSVPGVSLTLNLPPSPLCPTLTTECRHYSQTRSI